MNVQQTGIITLIKSAINGCAYTLPEGFDMEQAVQEALRHKILALIYYGAINCGVDKKEPAMQTLFRYVIATMNITEKQFFEVQKICARFDEQGIEYLPMKGTVLQPYYPKREMRTMGDADILIRMEQYETIKGIMSGLGYEFSYESDHELVWKKGKVDIELHKRVMTSYNKDFFQYFGDGWKFAQKCVGSETRYKITDEDFYIYMFVHFTKHYRVSGIGIKHLVDFWVYRNAHKDLDEAYINERLKMLQLEQFHDYVLQTVAAWFDEAAPTPQTEYITEVIFTSGEYGLAESVHAAKILRESKSTGSVTAAKQRTFWRIVFLPYPAMREKYRAVKAIPLLLPLFWLVRLVDIALLKREKVSNYMKHWKHVDEDMQKHQQALQFVGLEFHAEE